MRDYYQGRGSGLTCLGVGWDGETVSNVAGTGDSIPTPVTPSPVTAAPVTAAPTEDPIGVPGPVTPAPTNVPTTAPVTSAPVTAAPTADPVVPAPLGCINIYIGYSQYDGTWDEVQGGYDGRP